VRHLLLINSAFSKKMPIPQTLDNFDVPAAVARMLDRPSLWWEALTLFVEHFADWESAWLSSAGDDAAERRLVHALRSAAANVGATGLSASAAALEQILRQGQADATGAEALRHQLQQDFRQTWRTATEAIRPGSREAIE